MEKNKRIFPLLQRNSQHTFHRHRSAVHYQKENRYQPKVFQLITKFHGSMNRSEDNQVLNSTKMRFNQRTTLNQSKLGQSQLRKIINVDKLVKIEKFQKKKKRIIDLDFSQTFCQQKKQKNRPRISLQISQSFWDDKIDANQNTKQSIKPSEPSIKNAYFNSSILYELDMLPLKNICYDSQFPFKREGDCMTMAQGKLYLIGGCIRRKFYFPKTQNKHQDLMLHYYGENQLWNQEKVSVNNLPKLGNLIGHTVQKIQKNIIALTFGMSGDSVKTLNQFNTNIILFNIDRKQFREIPCNMKIRCHASTYYDKYLIIHGGINQQHKHLKQMHIVCFLGEEFSPKIITIPTGEELANHKMVTTLGMDIASRIILKNNDGVFIFGGENSQGKMHNHIKILRLSPSNIENERKVSKKFEKITTKGQKPCSRTNHSMNLLPSRNKIAIIGGTDSQGNILSDIWMFDLIYSQWMQYGSNPDIISIFGGITKHASAVDGTKLYIYGGCHLKDVGSNNFWAFELDNSKKSKEAKKNGEGDKVSSFWSISTKNIIPTVQKLLEE